MTYSFLPSPYCDFTKMREQVYYHLFPSIDDDLEFIGLVDAQQAWAEEAIELIQSLLTELGHDPEQWRYWDWRRAYGVKGVKELPSSARLSDFHNAIEARDIKSLATALKSGEFDPIRWFFPKPDGHSLVAPIIPDRFKAFRSSRLRACLHLSREALYEEKIVAYYKNSEGVHRIENNNLWLDDTIATSALERGTIEYSPRRFRTSLGRVEMIFNKGELNAQFPPFQNARTTNERTKQALPDLSQNQNRSKGGRKNKLIPAIEALRRLHPDGRPDVSSEILRRQVEGEIGMTVGVSTMTKAISEAWGN